MGIFNPINWKDRIVQRPRTYTEVHNQDGSRTDTPAPGEIQEPGTQISATNLNQMDQGIQDAKIGVEQLLIGLKQVTWRVEDLEKATIQEVGEKVLTNTKSFPFNDSKTTVALANTRENLNYVVVIVSAIGAGNIGDVEVSDRLTNGFKLSFTGSAKSVTVKYAVIGGYNG